MLVLKALKILVISAIGFVMAINNKADESYYNILTIDGGGIRGIISASCLSKIE